MMIQAKFTIYVTVTDLTALRAYALKRATNAGISEAEFAEGENSNSPGDNIEYWLAWTFDAGTPPNCGFQIEQSGASLTHISNPNELREG